jgi:hypothetical protein
MTAATEAAHSTALSQADDSGDDSDDTGIVAGSRNEGSGAARASGLARCQKAA